MKYLKTFESITNSIVRPEKFKNFYGFLPEDFEDLFVEMIDDLNLQAKVTWETMGLTQLILKIVVPEVATDSMHEWFSENIKPRLARPNNYLKNNFGLRYDGYQLTLNHPNNTFIYRLIYYKMKNQPTNESFFDPYYEEISESDFNDDEVGTVLFDSFEIEQLTGLSEEMGCEYRLYSGFFYGEWESTKDYENVQKVFLYKDLNRDMEYRISIFKRIGEEFLVSKVVAYALTPPDKMYYLCDGFDGLAKCLDEII
jgi:hypothetical protein